MALAIYFTWLIVLAGMKGQWLSIPFLGMFALGFIYVALGSIAKRLNWTSFTTAEATA